MKKNNCSHSLVNELLALLKKNGHNELPLTAKTLYKTDGEEQSPELISKIIGTGEYWHRGIQNAFSDWNENLFDQNVEIDVFTDGFPIVKSSRLCGWPILGAVVNKPHLPILLFGVYAGYGSPKSSDSLLEDFCAEANLLAINGILVGTEKTHKSFKIRAFLADALARAYVCGIKYPTSYNGCSKCSQVGVRSVSSKSIQYQTVSGPLRTDLSFNRRDDIAHHHVEYLKTRNALEKIGFPMVSSIPIDSMHCMDLGVTRKFIKSMINNIGKTFFRNNDDIKAMELDFLKFKKCITSDFTRTPRPFIEAPRYKAAECRQFLLYTGAVLLKPYMQPDIYNSFMKYHCAARLLHHNTQTTESLDLAQKLLAEFVLESVGFLNTTYNIHNLLHITDCVRQFGPLESFSNYKYENYLQSLKKGIKKATYVLKQIKNQLDQKRIYLKPVKIGTEDNFENMHIHLEKNDNYCLLRNGKVVEILEFLNGDLAAGRVYTDKKSFFTTPVDSMDVLGICFVKNQESELSVFSTDEIIAKYLKLPSLDGFVMTPILHNMQN
jgi:hypothetical protein